MSIEPDAHALKHITSWLKQLHDAAPRHSEGDAATKDKFAVLATLLGQDYPTGAFTTASLHSTAQGLEFFPGYAQIAQRVGAWWSVYRPAVARGLNDPRYVGLDNAERRWLAFWDAAVARNFGPAREGGSKIGPGVCGSMVRRYAPRVWDRLNPGETPSSPDGLAKRLAEEWDNDDRIYDLVCDLKNETHLLGLLYDVVSVHAPHHLHMVPPKVIPVQQADADLRRTKPYHLSREQLELAKRGRAA